MILQYHVNMPNVNYTIERTTGGLSGPNFTVTYTTGSSYYPVLGGSPLSLPGIASTGDVLIPSASYAYLAFKLTSIGDCTNSDIFTVTGSAP